MNWKQLTVSELRDHLVGLGWKEFPVHQALDPYVAVNLGKFHPTTCECMCNEHGGRIQVVARLYDHATLPVKVPTKSGMEFTLQGELPNEGWFYLKYHSLQEDLDEALACIPDMIAAWEVAHEAANKRQAN